MRCNADREAFWSAGGVLHDVIDGDQPLLTEAWPSPWRKMMMNKPDLKLPDFELREHIQRYNHKMTAGEGHLTFTSDIVTKKQPEVVIVPLVRVSAQTSALGHRAAALPRKNY
jgi:hypothetical protein